MIDRRQGRFRNGEQAHADRSHCGAPLADRIASDRRRRHPRQRSVGRRPRFGNVPVGGLHLVHGVGFQDAGRQNARLLSADFREPRLQHGDLHGVRNQYRKSDAIGQRRAVGVKQKVQGRAAGRLFSQHQRARPPLRQDFIADVFVVAVAHSLGRNRPVGDLHVGQQHMLQQGSAALPVDHLGQRLFHVDEFCQVVGHDSDEQERSRFEIGVALAVGNHQVVTGRFRFPFVRGIQDDVFVAAQRVPVRFELGGTKDRQRASDGQVEISHVVGGQGIEALQLQAHFEHAGAGRLDGEHDSLRLPGRQRDHFIRQLLAVLQQGHTGRRGWLFHASRGFRPFDAHEHVPARVAAAGIEGRNAHVLSRRGHFLIIELKGELEVDFGRHVAVGVQHDRFDGNSARQGLRHPQRVLQPARNLRHLQLVERIAQDSLVVGELGQLPRRRRHRDQAQPLVGKQVVDQLADFLLDFIEARPAFGINGGHAGRVVDQNRQIIRTVGPAGDERLHGRQHEAHQQ